MSETPASTSNVAADSGPRTAAAAGAAGRNGWRLSAAALIAVMIAVAALGIAAWQAHSNRQEVDGLRQELAKRLADVDAQSKAGRIAGDQLREATREASVKIGVLESKLAESQSQQIALESLYQDLSRNRDEWAFAEIEQTLLVASQQLQLAGNVRAALIALQAADTRLQHMNRPQLLALRKALSEDIARLKAAPFVDTAGLSVRIDTLIASADKLPLAAETRAPEETATAPAPTPAGNAWLRFWREVWADLQQLVRVQRIGNADVPLLAPAQAYFLRENLKLRLLNARMALLTRDQATFRGDLKAAQDWIARYFDARDKAVINALAALAALQKSEVSIELPDLSATLTTLRTASPNTARVK
ncbi:MAG TPA: uroporphyrinogen-III C-methyltransferase [Burkholderiales bacterium]|nr:uroporphyrinogen-III C-methyltransferase [Burkholderiales bacterium]